MNNLNKIDLQSVHIYLTSLCNLQCNMCDFWQMHDYGLSLALIKKFLEQARKLGAKEVTFSGGEPLIREDFFEIVKCAIRLGYWIQLTTNGTLIDKEKARILSSYIDSIVISVEGSRCCHDYIRGGGSFEKAISAVKLLRKYKSFVGLFMVVSKYSYHFMKELVDLAKKLDVAFISYQPFSKSLLWLRRENWDRYIIPMELLDDLIKKIEDTVNYARKQNITIMQPHILQKIPDFFRFNGKIYPENGCFIPLKALYLSHGGEIVPCPYFSHLKIGNLNNKTLNDIWNSNDYDQIRIMAKDKKCEGCLTGCTDLEKYTAYIISKESLREKLSKYYQRKIKERIRLFKISGWNYINRGLRHKLLRKLI